MQVHVEDEDPIRAHFRARRKHLQNCREDHKSYVARTMEEGSSGVSVRVTEVSVDDRFVCVTWPPFTVDLSSETYWFI